MEGGLGSVIFGYLLWRWTGNIWLAAIISVVLWPVFGPILKAIFQLPVQLVQGFLSLFEPKDELTALKDQRQAGAESFKGMRILLCAAGGINWATEREQLAQRTTETIQSLYERDAIFRHRLDAVQAQHLPVRVLGGRYKSVRNRCYRKFRKALAAEGMTIGNDRRDYFSQEKTWDAHGKKRTLEITIVFDKDMPLPEAPAADASVQANAEQTPPANYTTAYRMTF